MARNALAVNFSTVRNWLPLQTNFLNRGSLVFTDTNSILFLQRFYHLRLLP
jgi:hypothetical protein